MIISGRLRLVREDPGVRPPVRVEEEVGRGEAVGAIWALAGGSHDTTALCVRDCECVRMSRVSTIPHPEMKRASTYVLGAILGLADETLFSRERHKWSNVDKACCVGV